MWDPAQYAKYGDERSRPFFDLLARVPAIDPSLVVDLGCGTAELTQTLADRWPRARVIGVDSSAEMLASAPRTRVELVEGDLATWRPPAPADLVTSNAAIHWVADHEVLTAHLVGTLATRGVLAVQMPANFDAPSHTILLELAREQRLENWRPNSIQPLDWYVRRLWSLGCTVDAWETTYVHVLEGENAVLEWVKGTALRPVLALLGERDRAEFERQYAARLRRAYPPSERGTLFPFRRFFFVASRA